MLVAARRRHRGDCAFDELQEGVLDAEPQIFEARATTPLDFVEIQPERSAHRAEL